MDVAGIAIILAGAVFAAIPIAIGIAIIIGAIGEAVHAIRFPCSDCDNGDTLEEFTQNGGTE